MKCRISILRIFLFAVVLSGIAHGQDLSILVQGGISSYHLESGGVFKGGGDNHWKLGPIVGLGLRWNTSRLFSLAATMEFSTHRFDDAPPGLQVKDNPRNTIFDFNAVGRLKFGWGNALDGSFLFGLGYWHQTVDLVEVVAPSYAWSQPGFQASGLGGLFGFGLVINVTDQIDLYLDGAERVRKLTTPTVQLGIAYFIK